MKVFAYLWGIALLFLNSYNVAIGIMLGSLLVVTLSGIGVLCSLLFLMEVYKTDQ